MADTSLFPGVLPDREERFVDDSYSAQELERKDRTELQKIASQVESDDVNGQMSNSDLIEGLEGKQRV